MARCYRNGKKNSTGKAGRNVSMSGTMPGLNGVQSGMSMSSSVKMSLPGGGAWSATKGEVRQKKQRLSSY